MYPFVLIFCFLLMIFGLISSSFFEDIYAVRICFFITLFGSFIVIVAEIIMMILFIKINGWYIKENTKKETLNETFAMYFFPLLIAFLFLNVIFFPTRQFFSVSKNAHRYVKENIIKNYSVCLEPNCHQLFILDKDKFAKRKYQVEITEQCVIMKPLHNYDFLYYEAKKCGDEITEKEYHSTAKFLKNVATLKFSSVFNTEKSNGK